MHNRAVKNAGRWLSVALVVAGCSDGSAPAGSSSAGASAAPARTSGAPATSQSAASPSKMKEECAAFDKVAEEHAKKLTPRADASASASASGGSWMAPEYKIWEEHDEALGKLKIEDPKLKPLFDDYVKLVKKATATKAQSEAAATKAKALSDFISATMGATQARLMIGQACSN